MNKWVKIILIIIGVLSLLVLLALIGNSILKSIKEKQLEKARDTSRIMTLLASRSILEMEYQDNWEYPNTFNFNNKDFKDWETINWCKFWFTYEVFEKDTLANNWYRLSTCLESKSNKEKLTSDWWNI